jgi:hypothetical protein
MNSESQNSENIEPSMRAKNMFEELILSAQIWKEYNKYGRGIAVETDIDFSWKQERIIEQETLVAFMNKVDAITAEDKDKQQFVQELERIGDGKRYPIIINEREIDEQIVQLIRRHINTLLKNRKEGIEFIRGIVDKSEQHAWGNPEFGLRLHEEESETE